MTDIIPSEFSEQCLLVQYLELYNYKFSKLAQETFTRSWQTKRKNKLSGLRPGVPDMAVIIPADWRNAKKVKLLFPELKRTKGGVVSAEQKEWIDALNLVEGVTAKVCRGYEEARAFIEEEVRNLDL